MPSSCHWLHSVSKTCSRSSLTVAIGDSQIAEGSAKFDPEPFARIMCPRPSRSIAELLGRRFEQSEVLKVLAAWALIGGCIELEEDLVAPVGNLEDETRPTLDDAHGRSHLRADPGQAMTAVPY